MSNHYSVLTRILLSAGAIVCGFVGLLMVTENTALIGFGFLVVSAWMALVSVVPEYDRIDRGTCHE